VTETQILEQRTFPRLALSGAAHVQASVVGLGCWQLGADWGEVDEDEALGVLNAAVDTGVTFLDTPDVYGDGRSEALIGRFLRERRDAGITTATKMGRRVDQVPENYNRKNFLAWNDRSRANLGVDTIDLVQLHCPPTPVYSRDEVYDALDEMVIAPQRAEATINAPQMRPSTRIGAPPPDCRPSDRTRSAVGPAAST